MRKLINNQQRAVDFDRDKIQKYFEEPQTPGTKCSSSQF